MKYDIPGEEEKTLFSLSCVKSMVCVLRSLALILFYELHLGLFLGWVMGSGFSSGMSLKTKLWGVAEGIVTLVRGSGGRKTCHLLIK